jgi:hypothetical protein
MGESILKSASVNGTTTIWAATYANPSWIDDQTDEGTVTDVGTDIIWRETRQWNTAGGETYSGTYSCHVNATRLYWCATWGLSVVNGTTKVFNNGTLGVGGLATSLYTMTAENGTLVPLTPKITSSIPTATKSLFSQSNANPRH